MRPTASQLYPDKYKELAGKGFRQAVKLLAFSMKKENDEAFSMICIRLERAQEQMRAYLKNGLPDNLIDSVLEILKQHQVPFGKHQLKPTIAVVEMTLESEKNKPL